jgi:hypothetical protein
MNIKLNLGAYGRFSQFMIMIHNTILFDNIENMYFNSMDKRIIGNPYDWVFKQTYDDSYINHECTNLGSYTKKGIELGNIEESVDYPKLNDACSKIILKNSLVERVNKYVGIFGNDILGVHVRMGDMNTFHPEYGVYSTQDYINRIKEINPSSVFIASDNHESIRLIREAISCPVITVDGLIREEKCNFEPDGIAVTLLNNEQQWLDVWLECMLLSKCKELLCRVSNISNAAIIFSRTITTVHRL